MPKINKHIEIVRSGKPRLSSMSQRSCNAIFNTLSKHYSRVGVTTVNNLTDLEALAVRQPDLVFLGMRFVPANSTSGSLDHGRVSVATYLEDRGIACTGSGQAAHELEHDKSLAKQRALDAGLNTSPFYVIKQSQLQTLDNQPLRFPLFVKPTDRGGGSGIDSASLVRNFQDLKSKIQSIDTEFNSDSLVEEYLPGREFSVAILKNDEGLDYSIMSLELIAPLIKGARLLSEDVKSSDAEQSIKVTDEIIKLKIDALAIDAFHALGARDYGRIDIRLDKFGAPNFLEANLIPSLISGYGSFPKACVMNLGLDYESMLLCIVRLGLKRSLSLEEIVEPAIAIPTLTPFEAALKSV